MHQQQQNYSSALPYYRRAIELRPQLALAYLNLATSLLAWDKERHEEAGAMLLAGARLPGHGVRDRNAHEEARYSAYLQLSALHRSRGRHQHALEVLNEALATLPIDRRRQRAVLHQRLAAVHVELEQWQDAEEQQRLALHLQPEEGVAYVSYGQALARNVSVKACCQLVPLSLPLSEILQCSRYAEAELWFKRAVELSPLEPSTHHHYGKMKQHFVVTYTYPYMLLLFASFAS